MIINQRLFQKIATEPIPKCTCGDCEVEDRYYRCQGCKRTIYWCYGAADKYFDYCDRCVFELSQLNNNNYTL
jgi:hypothetical protein